MGRTVSPPPDLRGLRFFVVRYLRAVERFELVEPVTASTFDLGDEFRARAYLERAAGEYLGGRALDAARAFGASQAIPGEQRAFGLDLTKGKVGEKLGTARADKQLTRERLLGVDDDEVLVL